MTDAEIKAIVNKAMENASKVLGCDPAYYGDEGADEVDWQIRKLGYDPEYFKRKVNQNNETS